jgi:BolA protein
MTPAQRLDALQSCLQARFDPDYLQIEDESWKHAGHAGVQAHGGGHYVVSIRCAELAPLSTLQRHRLLNAAVRDLFAEVIHAISYRFPPAV